MARTWAWRSSPLALACACALLLAAHCVAAQSSPSGLYARPPSRPPLGESHPRLARSPDANSHAPEQVGAIAGRVVRSRGPPGSGAGPCELPLAADRRPPWLGARPTGPPPLQVHLAFAGPGAYAVTWVTYPLDSSLDAAAAGAQPQAAPASRRLAAAASAVAQQEQQLGRRRRHDLCAPVVGAAGRSMVQYGSSPGDYSHTGEGLPVMLRQQSDHAGRPCTALAGAACRPTPCPAFMAPPSAVEGADAPACYQSGSYVSGAIHRAVMGAGSEGPLPPNATVYYRVGAPLLPLAPVCVVVQPAGWLGWLAA